MSALLARPQWQRDERIMSGVFGKYSPTRWLRFLGLNPNDEGDHGLDQFLSLLCLNGREVVLARSLDARSPVSGAVPVGVQY